MAKDKVWIKLLFGFLYHHHHSSSRGGSGGFFFLDTTKCLFHVDFFAAIFLISMASSDFSLGKKWDEICCQWRNLLALLVLEEIILILIQCKNKFLTVPRFDCTVEPLYPNTLASHQKCSEIMRCSENRVSTVC